jgi:DNA-binding PadR family transcriptional regulator
MHVWHVDGEGAVRVREAVLALLARGPAHGYQLKLDYERLTRDKPVNVGQIYQTLERLQRDGFVEREAVDPCERRISYRVTEAGRAGAYEFLLDASQVERGANSDVAAKVLLAVEIAGLDTLRVLDAQRSALLVRVQAARRKSRDSVASVVEQLGLEADLAVSDAELRWLDLCEQELKGGA